MLPIGRSNLPENIDKTTLWITSDKSSFVSGQSLIVDGGLIWKGIDEGNEAELNEFLYKLDLKTIEEVYKKINKYIASNKQTYTLFF